jgi:cellulose synthase/poly-beta-1,6-N-acetylglucosamine synthase-like glycosyltransferase
MMRNLPIELGHVNTILLVLQVLLLALSALSGLYAVLIFVRAPGRRPRSLPAEQPEKKILVLVPARNEERSIGRLIASVQQADYPAALLGLVILADNCTDKTAAIARSLGAQVLERTDLTAQTKAEALKWALFGQNLLGGDYDAVTILDADSIVEPSFFRYIERDLRQGYPIVQGRRIGSNAGASAVAAAINVQYSFENRCWFLPHANRNRCVNMIGTGVAISCAHLRQVGWNICTLVEDSEFGIQSILAGAQIRYCDEARFLLEMPVTVKALWRQVRRWFSGLIDCARLYLPAVLKKVIHDKGGPAAGQLVCLLLPIGCVTGLVQFFLGPLIAFSLFGRQNSLQAILAATVLNELGGMAASAFVLFLDGRLPFQGGGRWKDVLLGIIFFPFSYLFYSFVFLYSFIWPKKTWDLMRSELKARQVRKGATD